jgi:periplasmic protein TonB
MSSYAAGRHAGHETLGFAAVMLLHVVLGYGLITALSTQIVRKFNQTIDVRLLREEKPLPPPDPPIRVPQPSVELPELPYVPQPVITINMPVPAPIHVAIVPPPAAPVAVEAPVERAAPPPPSVPDRDVSERPIDGGQVTYPTQMAFAHREGSVDVLCDIDVSGKTSNCSVAASSGGGAFVDTVMEFLATHRYSPRIEHGVPVAATGHRLHFEFKLRR